MRSASMAPSGSAGITTQLTVLIMALAVAALQPEATMKSGPNAIMTMKPTL